VRNSRKAVIGAIGCIVLLGAAHAGETPPLPKVQSLMEPFFKLYQAPAGKRAALMNEAVIGPNPGLYGPVIENPSSKNLESYLRQQEPDLPAIRMVTEAFDKQTMPTLEILAKAVGPLRPMAIYIAPSLFTSNGQVRMVGVTPVVAFGPDVQAYVAINLVKSKPPYDVRALVAHEVFHAQHYARNPAMAAIANALFQPKGKPPIYINLWIEGLATCASMTMDGDGSAAYALMSDDLMRDMPDVAQKLAMEFRRKADSTADADYRDLFWLSGQRTDIPKRAGYGVGTLVADQIVSRIGLRRAMALRGDPLRKEIMAALSVLAGQSRMPEWKNVCTADRR
jgi:hypothetical protein